jgi:23S rRNA (adenine2503-C2)-methyltransferase
MTDPVAAERQDIRLLTRAELETVLTEELGQPRFRAAQVWQWLWQKHATDFGAMSNLPAALRERLAERFAVRPITVDTEQRSGDGTVKMRFRLHDGHLIEGVLIPTPDRLTACVSSQVGCSLSCSFCATGFLPLKRNLTPPEIVDQVVLLNREAERYHGRPLSNIVFMGMGEPLLNYRNVLGGIERLTAEDGLHLSAKRITVSTAGIAKMIRRLGDDGVRFNLALSLHHTTDAARSRIMPINESNSLDALVDALNAFYEKTGGRITFEYILFDGLNESPEDAERLVQLCRRVPGARVNIIEYNPIAQADFRKSDAERREAFIAHLERNRVTAKVRRSRGKDIDAACGQLANKG